MRISEALSGVTRLYIEAAPLIYYVEENSAYVERLELIFDYLEDWSVEAISSVITLTEVLSLPIRLEMSALEAAYKEILQSSEGFRLLPVTENIAESAAHLRARYNLRTPDALHVGTAIEGQCEAFLTNDASIKRVTEVRILLLDALEIDPEPKAD